MYKSESGTGANAIGEQRAKAYLKDAQRRLQQACENGDTSANNALAMVEDALNQDARTIEQRRNHS